MGKLERIEVENFKSYKGKQIIGPFYDFTAVIGPNGAGKSNLMDAISFILGVQTSALRSSSLKDLIYRGLRDSRDPADSPKSAQVTAYYQLDNGNELKLTRTINSSGNSDYKINNKTVKVEKYAETLAEENILIEAQNFLVFQGQVESVATQSAKDLTRMIEKISGSEQLKADYERLKFEQSRATELSGYNFNKKRGMASEIRNFKDQEEEARKYNGLKDQMTEKMAKMFLWKLYHIEQKIHKFETDIQKDEAEIEKLKNDRSKIEDKLTKAKSDHSMKYLDLIKLEKTISDINQKINSALNVQLSLKEKRQYYAMKLDKLNENLKKLQHDKNRSNQVISTLTRELDRARSSQESHKVSTSQRLQTANQQDLKEYNETKEKLTIRTATDQQQLDHVKRQERSLLDKISQLNNKKEQVSTKIQTSTDLKNELNERIKQAETEVKNYKTQISTTTKELTDKQNEQQRTLSRENELNEQLATILGQLVEAKIDSHQSDRQKKLMDALDTLKRSFTGVHGRLIDLVKPVHSKYHTSVSIVLGNNINSVVVDNESTAIECIKYMKEQRVGQAKFIPLSTIKTQPIQEKYRTIAKGARLAYEAIECDESIQQAVYYACGNTLITDSVNVAKEIVYQKEEEVKCVALDGTVIHRGGQITGGGADLSESEAKRKWQEKEILTLKRNRDEIISNLNEISHSKRRNNDIEQLKANLEGLKSSLEFANNELSDAKVKLRSVESEVNLVSKEKTDYQNALKVEENKLKTCQAEISKIESQITKVESEIFTAFCQRLRIQNVSQFENSQLKARQITLEEESKLFNLVSKLESQKKFEDDRQKEIDGFLTRVNQAIETENKSLQDLQKEIKENDTQIANWRSEINSKTTSLNNVKKVCTESLEKLSIVQSENRNQLKKIEDLYKSKNAKELVHLKTNGERNLIFRKCQLDKIDLPLARGNLKNFEETQLSSSIDDSQASIRSRDWSIEVNFQSLSNSEKQDDSIDKEHELNNAIRELTVQLERIEPNFKVAQRLNNIQQTFRQTEIEFEQSVQNAKRAKEEFNQVRFERYKLFYEAYSHISERIDRIYKELTKSPNFPVGGTAYLSLENSEEPYLGGIKYHAMPPLKKFRDMEQLSGGEKSVAALALLLAIHSFKPSPFFVLDEVDAALDNLNVAKVAAYLSQHCGPDHGLQFIVISLKSSLYQSAQSLVGISRDQTANSSAVLTLDLTQYQDEPIM